MKYRLLIISLLLLLLNLFIYSCQHNNTENKYLGEIPAIAAFYRNKITDLEQKTDNCYKLEKAYEYAVRTKNICKEAGNKIETAFDKLPKPVTVPVIQDSLQRVFAIEEVVITSAVLEELCIEAPVYFQDSTFPPKTIRLQIINQDGHFKQPPVVMTKSLSATNGKTTTYTGVLKHPEKYIYLEAFKLEQPEMSEL
jgi:hypothetical protein